MATNSYDSTGVLVLDRITPVINAIFGDLSLRPLDLTRRQWFIATTSDSQHPSWTNITSKLALVAARLGASLSKVSGTEQTSLRLDWLIRAGAPMRWLLCISTTTKLRTTAQIEPLWFAGVRRRTIRFSCACLLEPSSLACITLPKYQIKKLRQIGFLADAADPEFHTRVHVCC